MLHVSVCNFLEWCYLLRSENQKQPMVMKVMRSTMEQLNLSHDWNDFFEMKQLVCERERSN